jgi:hypothetical protein
MRYKHRWRIPYLLLTEKARARARENDRKTYNPQNSPQLHTKAHTPARATAYNLLSLGQTRKTSEAEVEVVGRLVLTSVAEE